MFGIDCRFGGQCGQRGIANRSGLHGLCRGEWIVCYGSVVLLVSVGLGVIPISSAKMLNLPKPNSALGLRVSVYIAQFGRL